MNYLPDDLIYGFGLLFRILFYSLLISLMFFDQVRALKSRYNKYINILIVIFAVCYIGSIIPMFFDDKNYGGSPEFFVTLWSVFFAYLLIFNNRYIAKNTFRKTLSSIIVYGFIILIFFCNGLLNYHSYHGTWHGDFNHEITHGFLSFLLPISAYLFSVIKPNGANFGWFLILATILQFIFGISQSYGVDGYISDDTEFSILFILNTILFLIAGISNIIKKTII
ncbi:hypothetical protein [Psychroserpens sp.]|uniref:hypothetical protein n=1 Tax=Psychroserpens sp. TaxID=2020870 RepID=UPI00385E2013